MLRKNFFLITLLALAIMLSGCPLEEGEHDDTGFIPVGEWSSGFDSYTITNSNVDYFMEGSEWDGIVYPDTVLKGSIEKAVDFSNDTGVLIIKVTEGTYNTAGKYTGIYYSEYKSSSIKLSTSINADYSAAEADTLTEASSLFSSSNIGTYVSTWGSYTK